MNNKIFKYKKLMKNQSDKELVIKLKRGDVDAFTVLYQRYSKRLFGFCYKLLGAKEEAEDIVQRTFLKVWKNRQHINEEKSFSAFLYTISHNKALNILKRMVNERYYLNTIEYQLNDCSNSVLKEVYYNELNSSLEKLIKQLPQRRKEIFLLSRNEGLSYREIGRKLNISENSVNTQISLAIKFIKSKLFGTVSEEVKSQW